MAPVHRVFIDTNILVSAFWFEGPPRQLVMASFDERLSLVLSEVVIKEAQNVIDRKTPNRREDLRIFIDELPHETIPTPSTAMIIRHRKYVTHDEDAPVLASAVLADADYVVSGDKQFTNRATKEMVELISCSELLLLLPPKRKKP